MSDIGIGSIIVNDAARDAIHVAVAPVVASCALKPGEWVDLDPSGRANVQTAKAAVGVVDPFLQKIVLPGEKFWLFLRPGSISSLRHDWTHTAFDGGAPPTIDDAKANARIRLEQFAERLDITYGQMLEAAAIFVRNGDYLVEHRFEGERMPETFWDDFGLVTGVDVSDVAPDDYFFSCGGCS